MTQIKIVGREFRETTRIRLGVIRVLVCEFVADLHKKANLTTDKPLS